MKKILPVIFLVLFAWSCEKESYLIEPLARIKAIDGRLAFPDEELFINKLAELESASSEAREKWSNSFDYESINGLLNKLIEDDLEGETKEYIDYGQGHKILLNSEGLVQIGNEVILYKNGMKYYLDQEKFNGLENKEDIELSEKRGFYEIRKSTSTDKSARLFDANLDGSIGNGGDQFEFSLSDGSLRKFVTEFVSTYETFSYSGSCNAFDTRVILIMRIKLEGRPNRRRSWVLAPEPRNISWNTNFSNLILRAYNPCAGPPFYQNFPVTGGTATGSITNFSNGIGDVQIAAFRGNLESVSNGYGFWYGSVTGPVTQVYTNSNPDISHTVNF